MQDKPSLSSYTGLSSSKPDSVMNPVSVQGSKPSLSMYPDLKERLETDESPMYDIDAVQNFSRTAEEIAEKVIEIDKKLLLSDDSKKERLLEIDAEVSKLREEQQKVAEKMNEPTMSNALSPIGAFHQDKKAIQNMTAQLRALYMERDELETKLKPPTDQEKKEALLSFGIGNFGNTSDSAFKDNDFISKYGPKKAYDIYNAAVGDQLSEVDKIDAKKATTTDEILSYKFLQHGKIPELKHVDDSFVNKIVSDVTSTKEYSRATTPDKRKLFDKAVSKAISELDLKQPEGTEPVDKAELKKSIIANILPRLIRDEDGNITVEATKLYAENQLQHVRTMIELHKNAIEDAGLAVSNLASTGATRGMTGLVIGDNSQDVAAADSRVKELEEKHGKENIQAWYHNLRTEYFNLKDTEKELERMLEKPEARSGIRDIGKAFKTTEGKSLATLQISDMYKSLRMDKIFKKLETGDAISYADKKRLETYATLSYLDSLGNDGMMYNVTHGIINMVPYIASFAVSGGAFTGTKGVVQGALKGSTLAAKRVGIGKFKMGLGDMAARSLGAGAQTAVLPQMYVKNISDLARDNASLIIDPALGEIAAKIDVNSGLDLGKAVGRGLWSTYSEVFTERMGPYIMKGLGISKRSLVDGISKQQLFKNTALAGYMQMKGIKTVPELSKQIAKVTGWNGLFEEYLEELANYYMEGATHPKDLTLPVGKTHKEFFEQQLTTFLTVAGFSGIMKTGQVSAQKTIGRNVHFTWDQSGKTQRLSLPRDFYNEIVNAYAENKDPLFGGQITPILQKYQGKLSKDQFMLTMNLMMKMGKENAQAEAASQTFPADQVAKAKGAPEQPGSILDKKFEGNLTQLTPEERKEVETENERITKLYPDLVANNLIAADKESGQYLEPDKLTMQTFLNQVNSKLESVAEYDERGNITNPNEEINDLLTKKAVLEEIVTELEAADVQDFAALPVPDKHKQLEKELARGFEITGTASYVGRGPTVEVLEMKLNDGRTVTAYVDPTLDKDTKAEVNKAVLDNKQFSLRVLKQSEWNPMLEIMDKETGIPYGDKIAIVLDGKNVGSVQIKDYRQQKSKTIQQEQNKTTAKKKAVAKLNTVKPKAAAPKSAEPKIEESKVQQTKAELDRLLQERKDKQGNIGFAFDPKSKAEDDIKLLKAWIDYLLAIGAETLEKIKAAIMEFAGTEITDDQAQYILDEMTRQRIAASDFAKTLTPEEEKLIKEGIAAGINTITENRDIPVNEVLPTLIEAIQEDENMSPEEKIVQIATIVNNQEAFLRKINVAATLNNKKGIKFSAATISADDIVMPEFSGVNFTGDQKIDSFLSGFSSVWRAIADATETNKDFVERKFYNIAKTKRFHQEVKNEAQYRHFVASLKGVDYVTDKIAEMLEKSSFETAKSIFAFYGSLRLVSQFGFILQNNVGTMKLLNSPQRFEDFISTFWTHIQKYIFRDYTGYAALQSRIKVHKDEMERRFLVENRSYSKFEKLPAEEKTKLRIAQHEADLLLLQEVTGIKKDVWAGYFTSQTKETFAQSSRDSKLETDYGTYENLLKFDTYRNGWNRIQSTLAYNLWYKTLRTDDNQFDTTVEEFEEKFNRFFTQGDESKGALSNIFKLSTATAARDELASRGVDVEGHGFTSYVQDNMTFVIAEDIRNAPVSNELTKFYFNKGTDAEIIIIDGVSKINKDDRTKVSALNMSSEDLWVHQLFEFMQQGESYNAWMGQFADKPVLYFLQAPKRAMPEKDSAEWQAFIKEFPEFNQAVDWIKRKVIHYYSDIFNKLLPSLPLDLKTDKEKTDWKNAQRQKIAEEFIYNFAMNTKDIIEVFDGNFESYDNDLLGLVKRRGSSNSTGYVALSGVEGGLGEDYTFVLLDDMINGIEVFDGIEFMSGDYAKRAQVSIGKIFSKENVPGMEVLSSIKGLHSNVNLENLRGLTKGNIVNIDLLAAAFPGSMFEDLKKFMDKNTIDRLSFGSTTKLSEKAKGKEDKEKKMMRLWDENGKRISNPQLVKDAVIIRKTSDTYIQQDLRHDTKPETKKMSSQLLSNMRILPHGNVIAEKIASLQNIVVSEMIAKVSGVNLEEARISWIREQVNKNRHEELLSMLDKGMTTFDPGYASLIRKLIASHITQNSLEIPINRVNTQEIPDPSGLLRSREISPDGLHVMLPDIASSIQGARYAEHEFKGKVKEAIDHVNANKEKYGDLFDSDGQLMEWEISMRDGIIPGEIIMSTRTPADDLHAHTVGRLAFEIKGGNFTMLDRQSQKASGSDFDGDQRFNWTFYRNKAGQVITGGSKEGIANDMLKLIAEDYTNPAMNDKINEPINTNAYKPLVDKLREKGDKYSYLDPRTWNDARMQNMTGVKLKGTMTDLVTVYSLINDMGIPFKKKIDINYEIEYKDEDIDGVNIIEVYQGYNNERDSRKFNYYTTNKDEAKDYGTKVIRKIINIGSFLRKYNIVNGKIEYTEEFKYELETFKLKTGKRFDILDNSSEGLKTQYEFFGHLQNVGYDGYTELIPNYKTDENTYIVTFPKSIPLNNIAKDSSGLLKIHLANLLNMAFDNAKDPKIEIMGINEITAPMFVLAMIGNKDLDTSSHASIFAHVEKLSSYFNSPIVKEYVAAIRRGKGAIGELDKAELKFNIGRLYGEQAANNLFNLVSYAEDLSSIRRFYSLTQKMPNTAAELQEARQLYKRIVNNELDFISTRNFLDNNGHLLPEFRIATKALQLAEDFIYRDTFEYSHTGKKIYKAIYARIKANNKYKKYFTQDELQALSYCLNAIAVHKAIGITLPQKALHEKLKAAMPQMRKDYPNNKFLQSITIARHGINQFLEILQDYKYTTISDEKLEEIRKDFDTLFYNEPEFANQLALYVVSKWGTSTSTWKGSYFNLFSQDFRVDLSKKLMAEFEKWDIEGLTNAEMLQIAELTLKSSKNKTLRDMSTMQSRFPAPYDYNSMATIDSSVSYEALSGLEDISSMDQFIEYSKQQGIDIASLIEVAGTRSTSAVVAWSKEFIANFRKQADSIFSDINNSNLKVRDMMPADVAGELLSTDDPALSKFVFDHLRKTYPGVLFFESREEFEKFYIKNGAIGLNINPNAIGHAFANAVYIDPVKAVQSTMLHEYGHIYFDALPEDNKVKKALRSLYSEQMPGRSQEDIDEAIILDIGRAGVDIAKVEIEESQLDRFLNLLKRFWRDVKILFGRYDKNDLTQKLAWAVWSNQGSIKTNTNYADAIIRNMVLSNNKADNVQFNGETHTHYIGDEMIAGVTSTVQTIMESKFDQDAKAKEQQIKFDFDHKKLTHERIEQEETEEIRMKMAQLYNDITEKGTVVHAVAESVFGNHIVTDEEKAEFIDIKDYYRLIRQFEEEKERILGIYPDAIFYTERQIISKKFKIGGFFDLVVDIGDNKLHLYDFKTSSYEYADNTMQPTEKYKHAYSMFKAPFSNFAQSKFNTHMLQTNIYANILEEQEDPTQPGIKNEVTKITIIPIIRELENGKIKSANLAEHHVKIPRGPASREIANRLMTISLMQRQNFYDKYPQLKEILEKSGIAPQIVTDMIMSYHFFNQFIPDLSKTTREDMESFRMAEFGAMKVELFRLGYTTADLYGSKALPFELLFYNAMEFHIPKFEMSRMMDTYFPEQEVKGYYVPRDNPAATARRWHKLTHEGEEYILQEAGFATLKTDDEVMMVYDMERPTKEIKRDVYIYSVINVNPKAKSVHLRNQATGHEIVVKLPAKDSGALKIHKTLPEGIEDPGSNSYVPRYLYEKKAVMERHVDFNKVIKDKEGTLNNEAKLTKRRRDIYFMQGLFQNRFTTMAETEVFMKSSDKVNELIQHLGMINNDVSSHMSSLLREVAVNHVFANALAKEHSFVGPPNQPLPMTLNLYYIITKNPNANFMDFDKFRWVRMAMPQRMHEAQYIGLTTYASLMENGYKDFQEDNYILNNLLKEFAGGKIDYDLATDIGEDGYRYWRRPGEKALEGHPLERKFLEIIYEYHEKFDPELIEDVENGMQRRIRIANVYMTRNEAIKRWGSKWGPMFYEKLRPQKYDKVRLSLLEPVRKNGRWEKKLDKHGNEIIMTLKDIKEQYAHMNLSEEDHKRHLGPKWMHIVLRWPGTENVWGNAGLLNEYIRRAEMTYRKGEDVNNLGTILESTKNTIPVIGKGISPYGTMELVEAEAKSLKSMIFRYYMKDLVGPLEWMINQYSPEDKDPTDVMKYIKEWGEYILYNKKPQGTFAGEKISDMIDFFNRLNSLNKIMWSFKTQGVNVAIGQTFNMIREPGMYFRGMSKISKNPSNFVKAMKLAQSLGIANIVDDAIFDQVDKEMRILGVDVKKIEDKGYKLMEWAEKSNQIPILIGSMTDEEWDAYDINASVIPGKEKDKLTDYRRRQILYRIQDIHGDYSAITMAPWFAHNSGKAFMQFKKWIPALIWSQIAPYHIDRNLMVRSGIIPTVGILAKIVIYNNFTSVGKKQDDLQRIIEDPKSDNSLVIESSRDYFDTLIKEANGGRIKYKQLSQSDKKNARAALLMVVFKILMYLVNEALNNGPDDPDEYKKFSIRNMMPLLKRFEGDVFWMYSVENWEYFTTNMIPFVSILMDSGKFMVDLSQFIGSGGVDGRYKKETISAWKGMPKFMLDATHFLPAGSFIRWANQKARIKAMKWTKVDLVDDYGISEEFLEKNGFDSRYMSVFDIREKAMQYKKVYQVMKDAATLDALDAKGIGLGMYFDLTLGEYLLDQERNELNDALNMMRLEQMIENGELGSSYEDMLEKARELREEEEKKKSKTKAKIKRNYYKEIENYK